MRFQPIGDSPLSGIRRLRNRLTVVRFRGRGGGIADKGHTPHTSTTPTPSLTHHISVLVIMSIVVCHCCLLSCELAPPRRAVANPHHHPSHHFKRPSAGVGLCGRRSRKNPMGFDVGAGVGWGRMAGDGRGWWIASDAARQIVRLAGVRGGGLARPRHPSLTPPADPPPMGVDGC